MVMELMILMIIVQINQKHLMEFLIEMVALIIIFLILIEISRWTYLDSIDANVPNPLLKETYNRFQDDDGCPDYFRIICS